MHIAKKIPLAITVIIIAGLIALWLYYQQEAANEVKKITVGHLVALDMAPLFVAKEAGYFDEVGLDVELKAFVNVFENNKALADGQIDFSLNPFTLPYFALNDGVPIRTIASGGGWGIIQVVINDDYGISSLQELADYVHAHPNEKIKVGSFKGDTLDLILYDAFQNYGLSYQDFEMVWFTDLLAMVDSFKRGEIDVLSHIKPYTTDLIINHNAKFLTDNATIWNLHTPNCVLSVLDQLLVKNPEVINKFLLAEQKAAAFINKNPGMASRLLQHSDYPYYFKVSPKVLFESLSSQAAPITFTPNLTAINSVMFEMVQMNYIGKYTPARELFRLAAIRQLESSAISNH